MKSSNNTDELAIKVRNGLFLAASRRYAEGFIEPMIREYYGFDEADNDSYDAKDRDGNKIEIKACKVLRSSHRKQSDLIIDQIIFETKNLETDRLIPWSEAETADYTANIQNVKRDDFDYLIYVLMFEDCVKIYKIKRELINSQGIIGWSDKHGRYDALGKSGQFNINKDRIRFHDKYLIDTLDYKKLVEIYQSI